MKISKKTFDILKNFSGIRSSIHVEQGNTIRTVSVAKNIMAEAKVEEDFPRCFAIYDLGEFISATSLFTNSEYQFDDKSVVFTANNSSIGYPYADEKLVEKVNKTIKMPSLTVEFDLSQSQIAEMQKASSVLRLDTLCIRNTDEGKIEIVTFDRKIGLNTSLKVFTLKLDEETDDKFSIFVDIELLKLIPDDYHVEIGGTAVAKFTGKNNPIAYWIALRSESTKS